MSVVSAARLPQRGRVAVLHSRRPLARKTALASAVASLLLLGAALPAAAQQAAEEIAYTWNTQYFYLIFK